MDLNKTITEIIGILVDSIIATNDIEQLKRFNMLIDKFNTLINMCENNETIGGIKNEK